MVKYCAAYNCSNSDTTLNRKQGITFHRFPKDNKRKQEWAQALCRVDPLSGNLWTPSVWDMICSQHFTPECFREINGKKFLKEGSCPSVFSFPDDCKKTNTPKKRRKNSKYVRTFGVPLFQEESSNNGTRSEQTTPEILSNRSQDSLENISEGEVEQCSSSPEINPTAECNARDRLMTEHHYHITDSPKTLKRKLDELLMENDNLRRRLRNTSFEEQILHKNLDVSLDNKHSKSLLRETT
ncbi:THAP domain-containing protein 6-like isoform X1 [Heteronotia binoei]|uniref:THAP domain-containing protein 6-like isoform X1 n=1 Tax=Heteronotia binoei TaxID=13085 RepID=UPI00292FDA0D|nr:THAP domain-containing protein 6-like isoform X1 [Heteronotia binoei]XP_060091920.1 THAP domain-containing protein 6-like isoform X1 [Heteronotia binoei]XP_060091921.1 THAP domain-containing protein 6-like isoform X1 [Heteronotia binoei]XP_060091922.1 THAP domain-containing protein 6-like isoform X1 [Heteronotia binoei]